MTELDALRELQAPLQAQLGEILWTLRILIGGAVVCFGASFGLHALSLRRQGRIEERQARLEAWQAEATPPLRKLAASQRAEEARQRLEQARRPHVSGDPDAPC